MTAHTAGTLLVVLSCGTRSTAQDLAEMSVEVKNPETYLECCFWARQPKTPHSGLKAVERLQLKELLMSKGAFVSQPRVAAGCGEMVWAGSDGLCLPASWGGWSSAALCKAGLVSSCIV